MIICFAGEHLLLTTQKIFRNGRFRNLSELLLNNASGAEDYRGVVKLFTEAVGKGLTAYHSGVLPNGIFCWP